MWELPLRFFLVQNGFHRSAYTRNTHVDSVEGDWSKFIVCVLLSVRNSLILQKNLWIVSAVCNQKILWIASMLWREMSDNSFYRMLFAEHAWLYLDIFNYFHGLILPKFCKNCCCMEVTSAFHLLCQEQQPSPGQPRGTSERKMCALA